MDTTHFHDHLSLAKKFLRLGQADEAARIIAPDLELLVRGLLDRHLPQFTAGEREVVREKLEKRTMRAADFVLVVNAFSAPSTVRALARIGGWSERALSDLTLHSGRIHRNAAVHGALVTLDEARQLVGTVELLAAYAGIVTDATHADWESTPPRFTNREGATRILVGRLWRFPDEGGSRASWAVKESAVLRGALEQAAERPGLGIALFTTELAAEIFGAASNGRVQGVIEWGLGRVGPGPSYLIEEPTLDPITGVITTQKDFRHSLALATLMARQGSHGSHRRHYLELAMHTGLPDGGWAAQLGGTVSDLAATAYVAEFLATSSQATDIGAAPRRTLHEAQEWLCMALTARGSWCATAPIFPGEPWEQLWSTAYFFLRLNAHVFPTFPDWAQALGRAARLILEDARSVRISDDAVRWRVEARVAAALSVAVRADAFDGLYREYATAWLAAWEVRFLAELARRPVRECDLATVTFSVRALLRDADPSQIHRIDSSITTGSSLQ